MIKCGRDSRLVVLILALGLCSLDQLRAATYYVSTAGRDSDSGTASLPWRTIQNGVNTVSAGDTILVDAGSYGERVTTVRGGTGETNRITIQAQGEAIVKGWVISHAYVTVDGFQITGHSSSNQASAHVEVNANGDFFHLLNCTVRDAIQALRTDFIFRASDRSISSATGGFIAAGFAAGQTIYIGNATNTVSMLNLGTRVIESVTDNKLTVTTALQDQGPVHGYISGSFVFGLFTKTGTQGCIIRGNTFRNLGYKCWFIDGTGHLLEGNTLEQGNGWEVFTFAGTNHIFRRNYVHDSPIANHSPSPDIIDNWVTKYERIVFTNNFIENFQGTMGAQKLNATVSGPLLLTHNVFIDTGAFYVRFPNTTIENNTFLRVAHQNNISVAVARHPLFFDMNNYATNAVIRNNIFVDCGQVAFGYSTNQMGWYEIDGTTNSATCNSNFSAGPPPGYNSKIGFNEGNPALNGGDPGFVNINDPVGPDGVPFTEDDGLRLRIGSKLLGAGEGGVDLGAYNTETPRPRVIAVLAKNGLVQLSWPASANEFILQTATAPSGTWIPSDLTPVIEGDSVMVQINATNPAQFFRLAK